MFSNAASGADSRCWGNVSSVKPPYLRPSVSAFPVSQDSKDSETDEFQEPSRTLMPDTKPNSLDDHSMNAIRVLSMDAVQKADSGLPGTAIALAPLAYVLWTRDLRYNPHDPDWIDRDRFVL